ncbi:MAG TPA: flippase-like domain-containing protein [Candidatus Atribacteria bacterium]|nr:flippase-like domain-containing protein [Candidatus Atribacteria bacterium]
MSRSKTNSVMLSIFKKSLPLIGVAIFVYLAYTTGIDKIFSTFLKFSPLSLIVVSLISLIVVNIYALQWQYILRKQKIKINFLQTLKIFLIGCFYGSISPGYLAQHIRVIYLKKVTKEPYGKLFAGSIIIAVINIIAICIMSILGSLLIIERYPSVFYTVVLSLTIFAATLFYFIKKERGEKIFYLLIKFLVPKKIKGRFRDFIYTLYDDFPNTRDFIAPLLFGFLILMVMYTQFYILAISLGIKIPFLVFIFLLPIANVTALLPITPAGLGTREAVLILLLSLYDIPAELSIALSLTGYLLSDFLYGIYGLIVLSIETLKKSQHIRSDPL